MFVSQAGICKKVPGIDLKPLSPRLEEKLRAGLEEAGCALRAMPGPGESGALNIT